MSKAKDFRKKYEDAGVLIEIVKFDDILQLQRRRARLRFELAKSARRARDLVRDVGRPGRDEARSASSPTSTR